jgi:preprotein translocase subunit SecF
MKFREIIKKTNINFIGARNKTFLLSGILVLLGIVGMVMVTMGKANLSVDFTGGTQLQIGFSTPVAIGDLRSALASGGIGDATIQEIAGKNEFQIKTRLMNSGTERVPDKIGAILSSAFPGNKFQLLRSDMVGSVVGKDLKKNAIIAIVLSLIGIIIYIWIRFDFSFGVAATIATLHDVFVLLGIFYVSHLEMNILFITALLTIAGYSLTDTVVVYDRIRENMLKMKSKSDFAAVINTSINEVLSRTLITSLTTLIASASLLVLGGANLFDFSFALFFGVLVGTYSSIFVASPLVYLWRTRTA